MLTLQFGQCGNQVGEELFSAICADIDWPGVGISRESNQRYVENAFERWFASTEERSRSRSSSSSSKWKCTRTARALLLDTEEKVVRRVANDWKGERRWTYRARNALHVKGLPGSANNWACGYTRKGEQLDEPLMNAVGSELERLDRPEGFLLLLSSAGGTGSGLGCKALELLRREYPTKALAAAILLPHACGEIAVQHYNTALTLPRFNDQADVVLLFENSGQTAPRDREDRKSRRDLGFEQINTAIAEDLIGLLQPVGSQEAAAPRTLSSLLSTMSPHPSYKFPTVGSAFDECDSLRAGRGLARFPARDRAVSDVLIARGCPPDDDSSAAHRPPRRRYVPWADRCERYICFREKRRIKGRPNFFTLSTNSSRVCRPLDAVLQTAWTSYASGAFLHNYKEFGLEEDDFLRAFAAMEDVVRSYKQLQQQ